MNNRMRAGLALVAAGLLGGGAVAVAESTGSDRAEERQAFLEHAAARLGVEAAELENALEEAAVARVDAAVAAGRLTEEQAERMKERIRSGNGLPGWGFRGGPHGGPGFAHGPGFLAPAASYLGLEETELRERLAGGESLADVAEAQGKSVEGLVDALLSAARERLDEAVERGRLDEDGRDALLERIRERMADLVQGTLPGPGERGRWHGRGRPDGV